MTAGGPKERTRLAELARLFLKLGTVAFGGPAAHIAMMEDEVVRRRGWLSREEFLDYLGATNLIPGPNSTEMAIHIGRTRAGWPGLLVAGVCFILPAALIVTGVAWAYVRFGGLPAALGILAGVKPVVIAVVLQALWGLGRAALKSRAARRARARGRRWRRRSACTSCWCSSAAGVVAAAARCGDRPHRVPRPHGRCSRWGRC